VTAKSVLPVEASAARTAAWRFDADPGVLA